MKASMCVVLCVYVLVAPPEVEALTIGSDGDSYLDQFSSADNFGTEDHMWVKRSAPFNRKAIMRFDLSSLPFDHTADLVEASLILNFFDSGTGTGGDGIDWEFEVYGVIDGDPGEAWDETMINWSNAPQNDTGGDAVLDGATFLGTFDFIGKTASIDFSGGTAVLDFVAASSSDDLVTFYVVRNTPQPDGGNSYIHAIATKEHTTEVEPQLVLATTGPPTLAGSDIVDDQGGGPVNVNAPVTYTLSFSKDIDESTVSDADFDNAGTADITFDSIDETAPGVFRVVVTPTTQGTLQFQVPVGASITDLAGDPLDNDPAIVDDTTINVIADTTAPTLTESDIVDDQDGMPISAGTLVTYTLTFSEAMNASTIDFDDFENAGSSAATIISVSATADPAVFEVLVEPDGVGTLQLQIIARATLEDRAGHALDTSSAISDSTVIAVRAPPSGVLVTGVTAISSFSTATFNRTPAQTVDGSGLNDSATPDDPASWTHQGGTTEFGVDLNWLAFASEADPLPGVENHWIAFDLGEVLALGSMNVFNFGVSSGVNNARGVNQADIYYRSDSFGSNSDSNDTPFDNTGWALLGTAGAQTFDIGPTDGLFQGATNVPLPITARYIAVDINSSHGDSTLVGLGEVQFFTGEGGFQFEITDIRYAGDAGAPTITWNAVVGQTYAVDFSVDLVVWQEIDDGVVATGALMDLTDPDFDPVPGRRYYRVRLP